MIYRNLAWWRSFCRCAQRWRPEDVLLLPWTARPCQRWRYASVWRRLGQPRSGTCRCDLWTPDRHPRPSAPRRRWRRAAADRRPATRRGGGSGRRWYGWRSDRRRTRGRTMPANPTGSASRFWRCLCPPVRHLLASGRGRRTSVDERFLNSPSHRAWHMHMHHHHRQDQQYSAAHRFSRCAAEFDVCRGIAACCRKMRNCRFLLDL